MADTNVGMHARMCTSQSAHSSPLRGLRKRHRWSLKTAAAKARMDESHLSKVERGLAGLSVDTLARLAEAYGLVELSRELAPYVREAI